jgi:predicted AAA+ superfamily ATPase
MSKNEKVYTMNYIKRYLEEIIFDPLFERQIKIITGPRQCGKTTLAKNKLKKENCERFYYNWDSSEIKRKYRIPKIAIEAILG